ncbi:uncharacterized protein LOC108698123 [Xenopus laevis]|uniref:Uncharacterized protein LOC108698123 n=2 Tax=Xenopus laevis TaxID=8355 RepID=A0A8J1LHQ0_XENLA|nr:uncharacterized protein LOC108698123 [Xenopus laevis]
MWGKVTSGHNMELDETMCKEPVCQHPQCWGSFHRIDRGIPHYRPLGYCQRSASTEEGGLPVLSVSTMPGPPLSIARHLHAVSPIRLAGLSYSALYKLYNKTSSSIAKKMLPNVSSHNESKRSRTVGHRASPRHKPDVTENRITSLVWMPTTLCPQQKQEEKLKPLRVGITELTLERLRCKDVRGDSGDIEVPKLRRKTQVPTGGCPHNLSLTCIQPSARGSMKCRASGSSATESMLEFKGRYNGQHIDTGSLTLSAPEVENQRVVLHSVKDKHQQGAVRASPVYKLDDKHLEALNDMEIKVESIRNQYYLWNKYMGLAKHSGRMKAQDPQSYKEQTLSSYKQMTLGVIGNLRLYPYDGDYYKQNMTTSLEGSTPYACGSDRSRRLISLGSVSHGSWAESDQSSAGTDSLPESGTATQREEANADVTSRPDVPDITLGLEVLQQTHTLGDTGTLPTDPSKPAIKDVQAPLEPVTLTPQPNAPPPTPMNTEN